MRINSNVSYKRDGDFHYKVNSVLKRITLIHNNEVTYLDYDTNIEAIKALKSIKMNQWKQIENGFFISRHFEWEYNGIKYRTTDKHIQWSYSSGKDVLVFHNGKIWKTYLKDDRVYLERELYEIPTRKVLFEKKGNKIKIPKRSSAKWTGAKYCRHFEPIDESTSSLKIYNISRHHKTDASDRCKLSSTKKRWVVNSSKAKLCLMTEREADDFVITQPKDSEYYYFKSIKIQ